MVASACMRTKMNHLKLYFKKLLDPYPYPEIVLAFTKNQGCQYLLNIVIELELSPIEDWAQNYLDYRIYLHQMAL